MRAWRTHEYGPRPTEVLKLDAVSIPEPQAGEVRVRGQSRRKMRMAWPRALSPANEPSRPTGSPRQ